jgi:outer membrane protein
MVAAALLSATAPGSAQTLTEAFAYAYNNNPQLLAQRALLRSTDEQVPQALSNWRPTVNFTGQAGFTRAGSAATGAPTQFFSFPTRSLDLRVTQPLYRGGRTEAQTRQAINTVQATRAQTLGVETTVFQAVAQAYLDVVRDQTLLEVATNNEAVLRRQLEATRDRFRVGEVTRTDVAQAESRLAAGRAQVLTAESNYVSSKAVYRQTIGVEAGTLAPASPVDRFSPRTLAQAVTTGRELNPSVAAAMFGIDVAALQVKINEGALAPTVTATASVQQQWETNTNTQLQQFNASLVGQVTVPIYQGGAEYSLIRQSKETLGQQRISLDTARDQVQAQVVQSWGQLEAAKAQIQATQAQVNSAEIALNGVREEARVGQRTTLDVLNAQQELVNARVALVTAQHDRVVASYSLLSAVGGLSVVGLGLKTNVYDPMTHYQQVRDRWGGLRTPDGR